MDRIRIHLKNGGVHVMNPNVASKYALGPGKDRVTTKKMTGSKAVYYNRRERLRKMRIMEKQELFLSDLNG